jgi:hypothetical protein
MVQCGGREAWRSGAMVSCGALHPISLRARILAVLGLELTSACTRSAVRWIF